jgi:coenzyme F420-reducing hydrogenase beta subunit
MDLICEKSKCYGCGLCVNLCPCNAVKMEEMPIKGHFIPVIDAKICIDCGICKRNCPVNSEQVFNEPLSVYAGWRTNEKKQIGSSSGGAAAALYETALKKEYLIAGTVLDDEFHVKMCLTDQEEMIESFKGSKYVQADTGDIFKKIYNSAKAGKRILFIGTPCQCAAARNTLQKWPDMLITVDFVCHGVPSQKVLRDYLEWIEERCGRCITAISFRSDWGVEFTAYSKEKCVWKRKMYWDYYLSAFNSGILHNERCYSCPYAQSKRASDLTIGDFWGIGTEKHFDSPNRKVSIIAVNTEKGRAFLQKCTELTLVERKWEEAVKGNTQLRYSSKRSEKYVAFWDAYQEQGLDFALRRTIYRTITHRFWREYTIECIKKTVKQILFKNKTS